MDCSTDTQFENWFRVKKKRIRKLKVRRKHTIESTLHTKRLSVVLVHCKSTDSSSDLRCNKYADLKTETTKNVFIIEFSDPIENRPVT